MIIITSRAILKKIDPQLMKQMTTMSDQKTTIILHSDEKCSGQCRDILEKMGVKIKYELPLIDSYCVEVPYSKLTDIAALKHVKYLGADVSVKSQMNIASQEVKARIINNSGYTGRGVGIAIIDTGLYPHRDFTRPKNRIKAFKDFVDNKELPYDDNGHGSFVAGVAAGSGYVSRGKYQGIAPGADIIAIKSLDKKGSGHTSDILAGLQWVADHYEKYNIRVLSLSLGTEAKRISGIDAMVRAVEALWDKGITVVAAAGNSGPASGTITSPGVSSKIITVGAADDRRTVDISDDVIAEFSSRGPVSSRIKPDVVAPGVNVVSVKSDTEYQSGQRIRASANLYTTMSGTSVATPIVSGAVALLLEKYPSWTPNEIKEALMDNAISIDGDPNSEGKGIINLEAIFAD